MKVGCRLIREEVEGVYEWNKKVSLQEEDFKNEMKHQLIVMVHFMQPEGCSLDMKDLIRQLGVSVIKNEDCFFVLLIDKESPQEMISYWSIDKEDILRSYIVISRDKSKRIDKILSNCLKL